VIPAALVAGVFVLYATSYPPTPAGDGYWVIGTIESVNLEMIFNPPSLLTHVFFFWVKRAADSLGFSIPTLVVIQTVNGLAAGLGAWFLYEITRTLGGSRALGVLSAGLLAVSFGYWHFANDELQLISLVVLLLIFWLIVRARVHGSWGWPFVVGVGLLNALAVLLRQESVLFGPAAVALLCIGRPVRPAVRDALMYAVVGSIGTWSVAIIFGLAFVPGVRTLSEAGVWYLWLTGHVRSTQDFQAFEYATTFDVPRVVKGQLTALLVGTQTVFDALRDRALLGRPKVIGLIALTMAAYAAMVILIAGLFPVRRLRATRLVEVAIACAVWILAYKLVFHAWLWPTVTKYQVVTVPPLILLLVLGVIAAQKSGDHLQAVWRIGLLAALVVIVFSVDLWGGILPWRRYGDMKVALEAR